MTEKIVLGGGCFWCVEAVFSRMEGVVRVESGYAGGETLNPTYEAVSAGTTGHAEVVEVEYDPSIISLKKILEVFFKIHDPTNEEGQGADIGPQYRSIILYTTEEQEEVIKKYLEKESEDWEEPIVTQVKKLDVFYPAESEHKNYYDNHQDQPYCQIVIKPKLEKMGLK
ncbi:MAG: peptide-methionine (S)-S-oxide reductase MsrA [Candidatus Shapirobacteria bacterium]